MYQIKNCFDSHVHLLATGQVHSELSLRSMKSIADLAEIKSQSLNQKNYFRGEWLVGFGWNENNWSDVKKPHRKDLDLYFPDHPVFFSRVDGHASWVNSAALREFEKMGYDFSQEIQGGYIERDESGQPTGLLFDQAHIHALVKLPAYNESQLESFIQQAGSIFNAGGFTHVRDLSMSLVQWKLQKRLAERGDLKLFCESFITIESVDEIESTWNDYQMCLQNPSPFLRLKGFKLFYDGSLGSKTAYLSKPYRQTQQHGLLCWDLKNVETVLKFCWQNKIALAVHVIGDESAHQIVQCARQISAAGLFGHLHLEHVQILRPETIQLMKPLHVTCHMQPCHWLSDQAWLNTVLPDELIPFQFPWETLRKNKIQFDFGSDSPIEPSLLLRNKKALIESSKQNIPALKADWMFYHQHPDQTWGKCVTYFDDEKILKIEFVLA